MGFITWTHDRQEAFPGIEQLKEMRETGELKDVLKRATAHIIHCLAISWILNYFNVQDDEKAVLLLFDQIRFARGDITSIIPCEKLPRLVTKYTKLTEGEQQEINRREKDRRLNDAYSDHRTCTDSRGRIRHI
jgi:hypothetical protein